MTQPKEQNGTWSPQNPTSSVRPGLGGEPSRTSPTSESPRSGSMGTSGMGTSGSGSIGTSGMGTSGSGGMGTSGSFPEPSRTPARTTGSTSESPRSPDKLREDIARTRSALSEDVAALGDKLNPEHLKESAKEVIHHASSVAREGAKDIVRDAKEAAIGSLRHAKDHAFESISEGMHQIGDRARTAGHNMTDFVATHAVPLALLGAGLGWFLISLSHQRRLLASGTDYRYEHEGLMDQARARAGALTTRATDAIHDRGERVMERAHELQDRVSERAGELRSQISEGASHLAEQASSLGHRAYDGIGRAGRGAYEGIGRAGRGAIDLSEQNPLVTGMLALTAGVVAALLLPSTRRENQWMGGTRDRLVDRAQRSASDLKQSVQQGAEDVKGAIAEITHPAH